MTQAMILLQAAAPGGLGGISPMILLGGMILVFWLFMIRPQAKKAKQAKLRSICSPRFEMARTSA